MKICASLSLFVLAVFQGLLVSRCETFIDDNVEGCEDTVTNIKDVASHPTAYAKKTYRDINDFKDFPDRSKGPQKNYTWSELGELDGQDGRHLCIVMDRKVYDVTDFADQHPAGPQVLKKYVGRDATEGLKLCGMPPDMVAPVLKIFLVGELASSETGNYEVPNQDCDT